MNLINQVKNLQDWIIEEKFGRTDFCRDAEGSGAGTYDLEELEETHPFFKMFVQLQNIVEELEALRWKLMQMY